jgi:hypothetical protein
MPSGNGRLKRQAERSRRAEIAGLPALFAPWLSPLPDFGGTIRERLYPAATVFWLFLGQVFSADGSCREAVRRFLAGLARAAGKIASPSTSAYCQARARLKTEDLAAVLFQVRDKIQRAAGSRFRFHGRPVKVVDGTTISMPDTPENQAAYPQTPSQKPGLGFPLLRLVAFFSLATGAVLEFGCAPFRVAERTIFHHLWQRLQPNDIILADRGFCSFAELILLKQRGVDAVMRKHQSRSKSPTLKNLGPSDRLVTWTKTTVRPQWLDWQAWSDLPPTIILREITLLVTINGFRTSRIEIVTTLLDPAAFPAPEFAQLYRQRWQVELDLRAIKTTLGMEILTCKSPPLIHKELILHLVAYNLLRALILKAAIAARQTPDRISFKGALDAARQWAAHLSALRPAKLQPMIALLLETIARDPIPSRPNRAEPRALKRRPKPYSFLTQPRHLFHELSHRGKRKGP